MRSLVPLCLLLAAACGSSATAGSGTGAPQEPFLPNPTTEIGGERPAAVVRPADYDPRRSYPLVLLLHGYGFSGAVQDSYFRTSRSVDEKKFILILPDGTVDAGGSRFWNATRACCDFGRTGVDDVGYLRGLIEEASQVYNIDARRVFVMGHSNGGFMSYRMACDASDVVTAIASLAGATFDDELDCTPAEPVSVLQIHGTDDATILFDGGSNGGRPYPSAPESVRRFATIAGCDLSAARSSPAIDLLAEIGPTDTERLRYAAGCVDGVDAELWTMPGAGHIPAINDNFAPAVLDWLFSHEK